MKNIQAVVHKEANKYANLTKSKHINKLKWKSAGAGKSRLTFTKAAGMHCGGKGISKLEDGTAAGWEPGAGGVEACESKCTASAACTALVWQQNTKKCFWMKG